MKLALIGYGAMGKLVETLAVAAGDEIGSKVTSTDASKDAAQVATALRGHDVAIDFSSPDAVISNVPVLARRGNSDLHP